MSKDDIHSHDTRYLAVSSCPNPPASLSYPGAGVFQLTNVNLFEMQEGAVRRREHQHDVYHLVIFDRAENRYMLNGQPLKSNRGQCLLTEPGDTHSFSPLDAGETIYHAVTFRFENMSNAPGASDLLAHYTGIQLPVMPVNFILPETQMMQLSSVLADIRSAIPAGTSSSTAELFHCVAGLLVYVAANLSAQIAGTSSSSSDPEVRAKYYLDNHYADAISMAELGRNIGITPAHLSRVFSCRYGVSPGRYRDQLRMEAASNLLLNSDLLVKEIASELGYPDASTFSKAYHRHCGMSPMERRRERKPYW